jgi:hypothetical protein
MATKFGSKGVPDAELTGEQLLAEMKTVTPEGFFRSREEILGLVLVPRRYIEEHLMLDLYDFPELQEHAEVLRALLQFGPEEVAWPWK